MGKGARRGTALRLLARAALLVLLPSLASTLHFALPVPGLDRLASDPGGERLLDARGRLIAVSPASDGAFVERRHGDGIPAACREIFVLLEDRRFFRHPGVDPLALLRALGDLAAGAVGGDGARSGASTITMQLARMAAPRPRTPAGKLAEMALALRIEARHTKDEILGLYLDALPFGRNARGVGAAAWTYFGRDLESLTAAELLVLAVIPRNPSAYDPFVNPGGLAAAVRQAAARPAVAEALRSSGLTRERAGQGIEAAIAGARGGRPASRAPHFARHAFSQAQGQALAQRGPLRTGLDLDLNDWIESRIRVHLDRVRSARITNAAAVVLDNATGEVRAWVGSRDFDDVASDGQVDGVLIRRQSASTLKPFLYALALERGWTPATLLPDADIGFGGWEGEVYRPVNFDRRSRGVVRMRTALAGSLNVPAVFALSRLGTADFAAVLRGAGLDFPVAAERAAGLGAAVGNVEVTLLELARAFTVFPRGGTLPPVRVLAGTGTPDPGVPVFSPATAWTVCSMLSDPSARATGFGTRTYFRTPFPALFKSGTSSEFTNLWCVGATPRHTVAVWAGNFDGRAVINKTGSVVPARIVVDILERITRDAEGFQRPPGMREQRICTVSGQAATPRCPATRTEHFAPGALLPGPCAYHAGGEATDAGRQALLVGSFLGPGEAVRILFPADGQVFYLDPTAPATSQELPVVAAGRGTAPLEIVHDGTVAGTLVPGQTLRLPARPGVHRLEARSASGSDRVVYRVD